MGAPKLDRYRILNELGQGGMSVVYRARDQQLSRDVALKVLHDFLAKQEDARRRFHREAVAVAKLHHPGILEIFDYSGPDAEQSYIVTELIEGRTLREHIDRFGPTLFPEIAALVVTELTRALRHAHEQGVVHRDIKPENIMITQEGQLKLMDFGIAQIMGGATRLTATGTLLGSPAHMAPEVIDGHHADHRADIFSVGTILYWLASGSLPFSAPNPSALFRQILEGRFEPPQIVQPRIGNGLARIIERALEPDVTLRYQDVSELQVDLLRELSTVELEPPEVEVRRYLRSPDEYAQALEPRLIQVLAAGGQAALAEGNVARAMDRFNRVLAIDPAHAEARTAVASVGRREQRGRRARQVAMFLGFSAVLAATGFGVSTMWSKRGEARAEPELPLMSEAPPAAPARSSVMAVGEPELEPKEEAAVPRKPPMAVAPRRITETRPTEVARRPGVEAKAPGPKALVPEVPPAPKPGAEEVPAAEVPLARLKVRIGGAWADVRINEELRKSTFLEELDLPPGRHTVHVSHPPLGSYRARILEVSDRGRLYEVNASGKRRLLRGGVLDFAIPKSNAAALESPDKYPGWDPS